MILGYAARNHPNPYVSPAHVEQFTSMAHKEHPGFASTLPMYRHVAGQLSGRIQTLDPDRRRLAHDDLNENLLKPVAEAIKTGKTGPALDKIAGHMKKLAGTYGVQMPVNNQAGLPVATSPAGGTGQAVV